MYSVKQKGHINRDPYSVNRNVILTGSTVKSVWVVTRYFQSFLSLTFHST